MIRQTKICVRIHIHICTAHHGNNLERANSKLYLPWQLRNQFLMKSGVMQLVASAFAYTNTHTHDVCVHLFLWCRKKEKHSQFTLGQSWVRGAILGDVVQRGGGRERVENKVTVWPCFRASNEICECDIQAKSTRGAVEHGIRLWTSKSIYFALVLPRSRTNGPMS